MKKVALLLIGLLIISCSNNNNKNEDAVREMAKKDAIEKLQLPEGTQFNNENMEVTETSSGEASVGVTYLVKITIKSQDRDGKEIIKTHTFNYKKTGEDGSDPEDYELVSFE